MFRFSTAPESCRSESTAVLSTLATSSDILSSPTTSDFALSFMCTSLPSISSDLAPARLTGECISGFFEGSLDGRLVDIVRGDADIVFVVLVVTSLSGFCSLLCIELIVASIFKA